MQVRAAANLGTCSAAYQWSFLWGLNSAFSAFIVATAGTAALMRNLQVHAASTQMM
jgi:hypothetical protein